MDNFPRTVRFLWNLLNPQKKSGENWNNRPTLETVDIDLLMLWLSILNGDKIVMNGAIRRRPRTWFPAPRANELPWDRKGVDHLPSNYTENLTSCKWRKVKFKAITESRVLVSSASFEHSSGKDIRTKFLFPSTSLPFSILVLSSVGFHSGAVRDHSISSLHASSLTGKNESALVISITHVPELSLINSDWPTHL